jgi:replicative DNA helicase
MSESTMLYRDGDRRAAYEKVAEVLRERPRTMYREPVSVFDHGLLGDTFDLGHIEVPWPTLQRLTRGGVGNAELWYVAARLAHGKTYALTNMAARAAAVGHTVGFVSLEMQAAKVTQRVLTCLAGRNPDLIEMVWSDLESERKIAQDTILPRVPGRVSVVDPSFGSVQDPEFVRDLAADYDIVFVDHVGLMQTDGTRAIDDWRTQAKISNMLREVTLSTHTPIVAAAQINREGEVRGHDRAPKVSHLAGSDALGQDADVVVTLNLLSKRAQVYSGEKIRSGPGGRWHARYEPTQGRFEEISKDMANDLMDEDGHPDD